MSRLIFWFYHSNLNNQYPMFHVRVFSLLKFRHHSSDFALLLVS